MLIAKPVQIIRRSSALKARCGSGSTMVHRRSRLLDLLVEPFEPDTGLERRQGVFHVKRAWATAHFGHFALSGGWWIFECEGADSLGSAELRLVSREDGLLALSHRRGSDIRTYFHAKSTFDVSLLMAAWPGHLQVTRLRLRRLTMREHAALAGDVARRVLRSPKPLSRLVHVATRVMGGRSLRLQVTHEAKESSVVLPQQKSAVESRSIVTRDISAVLRDDEELHPRAMEIVSSVFAEAPQLQAVYADLDEGGRILPRPAWDPDLAAEVVYAPSPIFFRGEPVTCDPWTTLLQYPPGAVGRIALPLASRGKPVQANLVPPPTPSLALAPSVSIVIPTKIRMDLLQRCVSGLAERTNYSRLDVTIVDNGADSRALADVIASVDGRIALGKVEDFGDFNFSRLVNRGVRATQGEVVVLMNDDVEPLEPDWLTRLIGSAVKSDVGCVGARLLYPDGSIQHAGMMLGLAGYVGHMWKGVSSATAATIPQILLPGGRMAVTGACLAIRRDLFDRVGGLDEDTFPVAYNDVDLCLRVRAEGFRTIYRGDAVLIHHESQSRGGDDATMRRRRRLVREAAAFAERWGHLLADDPFGSPAFDPTREDGKTHPSLAEARPAQAFRQQG